MDELEKAQHRSDTNVNEHWTLEDQLAFEILKNFQIISSSGESIEKAYQIANSFLTYRRKILLARLKKRETE